MTDEHSRGLALSRAKGGAAGKTQAAKEASKAKREQRRPWAELRSAWEEAIALKKGIAITAVPRWGPPEIKLAKLLLTQVELAEAITMAKYFVNTWAPRNRKDPGFGLFFAVRGQIAAEVSGEIKPTQSREERKEERLNRTEYNPDAAAKLPKIGWG